MENLVKQHEWQSKNVTNQPATDPLNNFTGCYDMGVFRQKNHFPNNLNPRSTNIKSKSIPKLNLQNHNIDCDKTEIVIF